MDLGLSGKRVLLTGATRGIGRAILEAFLIEGAHVAFCARGQAGIDALMAAHPASAKNLRGRALDVRDADAFKLWVAETGEAFGGLDAVISNVSTRLTSTGEDLWRETFETDLIQHVRLAEAALPWLEKGTDPSLTFISSIAGVLTNLPPGEEAYGTAKAALINYAGQFAARHGPRGLRVNTVSPGPILHEGGVWDMIRQHQPKLFESAAQLPALKRHGRPEEVARTVVFLASPAGSYVTGANLRVDGGAVKATNF
jgi:NAD(P)-dependent dehydrogenase (short-subunit alcohol dehydrogenase family)